MKSKMLGKLVTSLLRIIGGTAAIAILFLLFYSVFFDKNDPIAATVAITNIENTSGGTGVILQSDDIYSTILSNGHVCRLVAQGGSVYTNYAPYMVGGYKLDPNHDLCLIKVNANLHIDTKLSKHEPNVFYESATISGHPALFPTVVTHGHFSGVRLIPVVMGFKPCGPEDDNSEGGIICFLMGGKRPIVKFFEAQLVTATIMPGSSGSGVYDSAGNLSNLVFAGSGDLGYAWTVPHSAVTSFLHNSTKIAWTDVGTPDLDTFTSPEKSKEATDSTLDRQKLKEICSDPVNRKKAGKYCKLIRGDLIWREGDL